MRSMPPSAPGDKGGWRRLQWFHRFDGRQISPLPVADTEEINIPVAGVPKCLRRTGSPASAATVKRDVARFWEGSDPLVDLIRRNVDRVFHGSGILNFF